MDVFLTIVHVLTCIFLIAVVLLQHGKGADIGAAFGAGASNTVFGSRGAGNFLTKLTTASVIVFMSTSLILSYFGGGSSVSQELRDQTEVQAPPEPEPEQSGPQLPGAAPIAPSEGAPSETKKSSEAPKGFQAIPAPDAEKSSEP